jgi:hypothetical protein
MHSQHATSAAQDALNALMRKYPPRPLKTPHGNGNPPPAFSTTSTETIDFSIGFGFAALIYVSL